MTAPSVLLVHEFRGIFGGAERYLELLGRGLVDGGARVSALVFLDDREPLRSVVERMEGIVPGAEVVIGRSRPGPLRAAIRASSPEVLHWNFVEPYAFRGASWLLLPWGRPSVITDHLPQLHHAGPHWETTRRLANHRIAAMIVVGAAARRAAAKRWRRPPPLVEVANGVPPYPGATARRPRTGAAVRLLFVGRLAEQKGAALLVPILEAVRAAGREATLTVVGAGPLEPSLRAQAAGSTVGEHVAFTGFADDPLAAMADADLLVAPSRFEGLPFTPLEALSTGLPVVLSAIGPHLELAMETGGRGVTVVEGDEPAAWADAVLAVASDLGGASEDALDRARRHSDAAMVDRTLDVYRAVLTGSIDALPAPNVSGRS